MTTLLDKITAITQQQKNNDTTPQNYLLTTKKKYHNFKEEAWCKGTGYRMPEGYFPIFDEKMEGLESGLFLLAGQSNHGKSNLLFELILRYVQNPANKLYGVYFSLDDTADKIIPRLLASNSIMANDTIGVPISLYSKPTIYLDKLREAQEDSEEERLYYSYLYEDITVEGSVNRDNIGKNPDNFPKSIRNKAYEWLESTSDYFTIIDGTEIRTGDQLIEYCKNIKRYIQELHGDPEYNLLVGIDSFSDIIWDGKNFKSDKELNDYTSKRMKALAVEELKCPVFGSIHLRKSDPKKRPTVMDIKESGRWAYEATIVFLIHNDVAQSGEGALIYANRDDSDYKMPIIEIRWAKNKQSSFKGYTYCYFQTEFSKVWECNVEATRRLNAIITTVK